MFILNIFNTNIVLILLKIENKKFAISRQLNISHFNKKKHLIF